LYIWSLAAVLFAWWLVGKFIFGEEGFIHVVLLCAVAVAVVQFVHERRAVRR
jgi:hypothetical protein